MLCKKIKATRFKTFFVSTFPPSQHTCKNEQSNALHQSFFPHWPFPAAARCLAGLRVAVAPWSSGGNLIMLPLQGFPHEAVAGPGRSCTICSKLVFTSSLPLKWLGKWAAARARLSSGGTVRRGGEQDFRRRPNHPRPAPPYRPQPHPARNDPSLPSKHAPSPLFWVVQCSR